jgi:hypothetical protein
LKAQALTCSIAQKLGAEPFALRQQMFSTPTNVLSLSPANWGFALMLSRLMRLDHRGRTMKSTRLSL